MPARVYLADPEVGPDDVLVKIKANGICRSDWHLWQGHWDWMGFSPPLPAVLGHESAGIVEEVGSNVVGHLNGMLATLAASPS